MPDFECPINPEWFGSNPFGLIGPQFITLQIVERAPFFSTIDRLHWQETEIDPRICKISKNLFDFFFWKSSYKNPQKSKNEGPPTQGHVVIQIRKFKVKIKWD